VESSSAKAGYEAATDAGNSLISTDIFKAKDKDGNSQEIKFHIAAYPGHEMKIEITQVIIIDEDEGGNDQGDS